MATEKGFHNHVWVVILVLSLLLIAWSVLVLALSRDTTLEDALKLAGSPMVAADFDDATRGFLNMAMLKPLWEETWIGILGVYCALGLRKKSKYAWTLGLIWGVMMMTNAAIQGGYEVLVLRWPYACVQRRTSSSCLARSQW